MTNIDTGSTILNLLYKFINNLISKMFSPINKIVFSLFPNFSELVDNLGLFLNSIVEYVNFGLNFMLITDICWKYIVISIIFRVTSSIGLFTTKLVIKWWNALAP